MNLLVWYKEYTKSWNRKKKFFVFFALWIVANGIHNQVNWRPIKFENITSDKKFKDFMNEKYPVGTDLFIALDEMKRSGAKCDNGSGQQNTIDFFDHNEIAYGCSYISRYITLSTFYGYKIAFLANKYGKITEIITQRYNAYVI